MTDAHVTRYSFWFFFLTILGVVVFKLATPFLTVLFSFFVLKHFKFLNRKWIAIVLYLILVAGVFYGFVIFVRESLTTLPEIASRSVPIVIEHAKKYGLELPFSDLETLKPIIIKGVREQVRGLASFAEVATRQFVLLIIGLVVAISLFLDNRLDLNQGCYQIENNLYSRMCAAIARRFSNFYESFGLVMGAQLAISCINTFFTAVLIFSIGLPYPHLGVGMTFLCGLLPIVGNLISNSILFSIAIVDSLRLAIIVLLFLIAIHKLEYFLNSKIIGNRIKNPMWLTLLGLIVGERIMGIPGMILAPVVLHYLKQEGSTVKVASAELTS